MTSRWSSRSGLRLLAVAAVLALALAGWRGWAWHDATADQRRTDAVADVASQQVTRLISISASTSDRTFDDLVDGATSNFRDELRGQASRIRGALDDNDVQASGVVLSAGVSDVSSSRATVLVAAEGTVANKGTAGAESRSYRVKVDVQRTDDRWLVSGLEFVE